MQPLSDGAIGLLAYFPAREGLIEELRASLASIPAAVVEAVSVPDVDWVAPFREGFRPFVVGSFLIAPPWDVPPSLPPGQHRLIVDPGRAFGTGTHETTRLCLAALEKLSSGSPLGRTLDLGTGTGILGLAAAALGARLVIGVDDDLEAIAAARRHARLNDSAFHVVLGDGASPFARASFDLVLANVTATVLLAARDAIAAVTAPRGTIVLSGLLVEDVTAVREAYSRLGAVGVATEGEWAALVVTGT